MFQPIEFEISAFFRQTKSAKTCIIKVSFRLWIVGTLRWKRVIHVIYQDHVDITPEPYSWSSSEIQWVLAFGYRFAWHSKSVPACRSDRLEGPNIEIDHTRKVLLRVCDKFSERISTPQNSFVLWFISVLFKNHTIFTFGSLFWAGNESKNGE